MNERETREQRLEAPMRGVAADHQREAALERDVDVRDGGQPHELTLENMDLFARSVLPDLRGMWDDEGWVNEWWPERLRTRTAAPIAAGGK